MFEQLEGIVRIYGSKDGEDRGVFVGNRVKPPLKMTIK